MSDPDGGPGGGLGGGPWLEEDDAAATAPGTGTFAGVGPCGGGEGGCGSALGGNATGYLLVEALWLLSLLFLAVGYDFGSGEGFEVAESCPAGALAKGSGSADIQYFLLSSQRAW